jgi:hypothetical protein
MRGVACQWKNATIGILTLLAKFYYGHVDFFLLGLQE